MLGCASRGLQKPSVGSALLRLRLRVPQRVDDDPALVEAPHVEVIDEPRGFQSHRGHVAGHVQHRAAAVPLVLRGLQRALLRQRDQLFLRHAAQAQAFVGGIAEHRALGQVRMQGTGDALWIGFQLAVDVVVAGGFDGRDRGRVGGGTR
ncbi:hypothetical protein G6F65_020090 [Rhizopus arrhizus]|nr:hypothetical protein G6F65_020090 [Rhizopus arrhizus]